MFPVAAISEPKIIRLGDRDIHYLLKRSQQRHSIVLTVDERGLIVSAPWRSAERRITSIIHDAKEWVLLLLPQRTRRTQRQTKYEEEHMRVKRKLGAEVTTDTRFQLSNVFCSCPSFASSASSAVRAWVRLELLHFTAHLSGFALLLRLRLFAVLNSTAI
ncbi:MAG TPA: hypothetical protein VGQ19_10890 [Burkholderiales bacterium]|nr:hypothetical protein [Burkholderiales bacterium]